MQLVFQLRKQNKQQQMDNLMSILSIAQVMKQIGGKDIGSQ